jgi:hypothetical protein
MPQSDYIRGPYGYKETNLNDPDGNHRFTVYGHNGQAIARNIVKREDAQRLLNILALCADVPTEELEGKSLSVTLNKMKRLEETAAELATVCQETVSYMTALQNGLQMVGISHMPFPSGSEAAELLRHAKAAVIKAEGK